MKPLHKDWVLISTLSGAALLLGSATGAYGWSCCAALALWSVITQVEKQRLIRWAARPLHQPTNRLQSWRGLSGRLYRTIRSGRARHRATVTRVKALRILINALPDAAIIVNNASDIENMNQAALRLLGLKASDRGKNLPSLARQPEFIALVTDGTADDIVEFTSLVNESVRLEARQVRIDDDRVLILVRDVTQLNRLLSMRQDFIANVSHELRTPLTVIVGYVETLLDEQLDLDTAHHLIEKLRPPTARMRALVDDLLLLTRLESSPNPEHAELRAIDMRLMISSVTAEGSVLSGERHRILSYIASSAQLVGVESEIHSACANLVTNAVRYSPGGGIITVAWEDTTDGAKFSVQDTGVGIAPEHLSRITERFYRVDLAESRVRGGTGLGLAIVKHVLKRHNCELKINSQLKNGSTFYFEIPESQLHRSSAKPKTARTAQLI